MTLRKLMIATSAIALLGAAPSAMAAGKSHEKMSDHHAAAGKMDQKKMSKDDSGKMSDDKMSNDDSGKMSGEKMSKGEEAKMDYDYKVNDMTKDNDMYKHNMSGKSSSDDSMSKDSDSSMSKDSSDSMSKDSSDSMSKDK